MNKINFLKNAVCSVSIFSTLLISSVLLPTVLYAEDSLDARIYSEDPAVVKYPSHPGSWLVDPTVIVCEGSMVTEEEVKAAMAFWYERGYYFKELLFHEDPNNKCYDTTPDDHIVIRRATPDVIRNMKEKTLAETHFYINRLTRAVEFATIYMVKKPVPRVLEHEFGHALGFYHYNKPGHIMHSQNKFSGWDDYGVKNMQRRAVEDREAKNTQRKSQEK